MKLILENWREYLREDSAAAEGPNVGQFLKTWQKHNPKRIEKILGKAAKWIVGLGTGAAVGAAATLATSGVGAVPGVAAGGIAGAAGAKLAEEAVSRLFGHVARKSSDLAKFMILMSEQQVPDDQRAGIALYYDLDDEYEALLQGMDSELANKYQEHLFGYFKTAFANMSDADPEEPLGRYIEMTANQYLEDFLSKKDMSAVGVAVRRPVETS